MAQEISKLTIYVNRDVHDIIKAKQLDVNSRFLEITLVHDNGSPVDLTGHLVRFNALKADGSHIFNNCRITDAVGGVFLLELTDQALAIGDSTLIADISVHALDEEVVLTTRTFNISIQSKIRDEGAVESSNEFNTVITIFQDVWDVRELMRNINERFGQLGDDLQAGQSQAGSSALGALNNIWNYLLNQSIASAVETINSVISMVGDVSNKVDGVQNILGVAGGSGQDSNTLMNFVNMLYSRGLVKSVQRGTVAATSYGPGSSYNVDRSRANISSVNLSKSVLIVSSGDLSGRGEYGTGKIWLNSATTIYSSYYADSAGNAADRYYYHPAFAWQVIEFY